MNIFTFIFGFFVGILVLGILAINETYSIIESCAESGRYQTNNWTIECTKTWERN